MQYQGIPESRWNANEIDLVHLLGAVNSQDLEPVQPPASCWFARVAEPWDCPEDDFLAERPVSQDAALPSLAWRVKILNRIASLEQTVVRVMWENRDLREIPFFGRMIAFSQIVAEGMFHMYQIQKKIFFKKILHLLFLSWNRARSVQLSLSCLFSLSKYMMFILKENNKHW